jgi:hypothetical protein
VICTVFQALSECRVSRALAKCLHQEEKTFTLLVRVIGTKNDLQSVRWQIESGARFGAVDGCEDIGFQPVRNHLHRGIAKHPAASRAIREPATWCDDIDSLRVDRG